MPFHVLPPSHWHINSSEHGFYRAACLKQAVYKLRLYYYVIEKGYNRLGISVSKEHFDDYLNMLTFDLSGRWWRPCWSPSRGQGHYDVLIQEGVAVCQEKGQSLLRCLLHLLPIYVRISFYYYDNLYFFLYCNHGYYSSCLFLNMDTWNFLFSCQIWIL